MKSSNGWQPRGESTLLWRGTRGVNKTRFVVTVTRRGEPRGVGRHTVRTDRFLFTLYPDLLLSGYVLIGGKVIGGSKLINGNVTLEGFTESESRDDRPAQ